jgi:Holliday junction resolvase
MSRGIQRERDRVNWYRDNDWFALRAPASLGSVDVVAAKAGERLRFEELKSTSGGPYHSFGPKDRADLSFMAKLAGADAYLVWWPPRSKPVVIPESDWP